MFQTTNQYIIARSLILNSNHRWKTLWKSLHLVRWVSSHVWLPEGNSTHRHVSSWKFTLDHHYRQVFMRVFSALVDNKWHTNKDLPSHILPHHVLSCGESLDIDSSNVVPCGARKHGFLYSTSSLHWTGTSWLVVLPPSWGRFRVDPIRKNRASEDSK